jgi:hypothetical protein
MAEWVLSCEGCADDGLAGSVVWATAYAACAVAAVAGFFLAVAGRLRSGAITTAAALAATAGVIFV